MKSAARIFYLAVFILLGTSHSVESKTPSISSGPDVCAISPKAIVSDACASYSTLDHINRDLRPVIKDLTQNTDFFSYYRLNLFGKQCPFWNDENGMCGNIACAVNTLENEEDIPPIWRADELGKLRGPKAGHPGRQQQKERGPEKPLQGMLGEDVGESCVVEYDDECDDRDYCVPEDEGSGKGDYVSLVDNPERFTGYAGVGARQVWSAIYLENCFSKASFHKPETLGVSPFPPPGPAALDFKNVLQAHGRQQNLAGLREQAPNTPFVSESGMENEDQCLEKRVFYRVVSGMHTSISTHLCWDYLNQSTGEWGPNLQCYKDRLHPFPDRVANLYFNYALLVRAVTKLEPYLKDYTFCSGDPEQDQITKQKVHDVASLAADRPQIFDESLLFVNGEGPALKEEFRHRFRNISRVMDCVGCDKCRLWGKVQTSGYGTALKVLFEFHENAADNPALKRTELVALFNTLARVSSSLHAIHEFRLMVEAEETEEESRGHHHISIEDDSELYHTPPPSETNKSQKPYDEFEEFEEEERQRRTHQSETVEEAFWTEMENIYKAFKYVIRGWLSFPKSIWEIFILELTRVWEFYVGLPVSPRLWTIRHPRLDEL
ncbi:endoplasmic reticulum Oxidoreductin 1-domain-containing protein [Xylogone sp. PMI_703]|nr:endoplasmic reticulum Oxidoreductin 1-domain-containing protein [Xylogone sp. PMI_703]